MNEAQFSVNWRMYASDGAQMQFTLRADDPDQHLELLEVYRAALTTRGYTVTEPGLDEGQKAEEVNAYVLGESSKGDACVYLYSSKTALQWRIATVYVEKFGELPFRPTGKKWEASAAPERGEAEKKGYLNIVPAFKIILEGSPDAESGKTRWRFLRVDGMRPVAAPEQPDRMAAAGRPMPAQSEPPPDPNGWAELQGDGPQGKPTGKQFRQAVNHAGSLFARFAGELAREFPRYASKQGSFDFDHITISLASLGFDDLTPGNIEGAFEALRKHAISKAA